MQTALEDLMNQVDATVRGAVRHKLRVSLRVNDFREQNLDGLDVLQEIRLKLIRRFSESGETASVQELTAYAATVAYRTCSDYLRARYPVRTSLKNSLRRILDKADDFAVWETASGEPVCGFPGWRGPSFAKASARILELREDPYRLPAEAIPGSSADNMTRPQWHGLLQAVFEYAGGPVPVDDLIAIVAPVVGMEDVPDSGEDDGNGEGETPALEQLRSRDPGPYSNWLASERLRLYWAAVLKLLVWHRVAYLLNHRDGDLEALPLYGVATLEEIGEALELTDKQFGLLARELVSPEPPAALARGIRFLLFWKYLPLEDNIIAVVLEVTRAQVIAYRNKARERLQRLLRGEI